MKNLCYLNHVNFLRSVAVILVILFHLDVSLFKGGFIGVDVFFVISGFLITRILSNEFINTGSIDFKEFYARRMRRLLPTLFLTIILTFILTFFLFSPSNFIDATNSMFMSSVALSNFYFLSASDYFDTSSIFKPLLHTWSLGVEEQFYLLYPATLFLLIKIFSNKINWVIFSLSLLLIISFFYTVYSSYYGIPEIISSLFLPEDGVSSNISSLQFYLLPFRVFEFLIGGIIVFVKPPEIKCECTKFGLNLLGLVTIIASSMIFSKDIKYLSILNLVPCLGVGILLLFPPSKYFSLLFKNNFLMYTGSISYTLYLIHWPIIVSYRYIFDGEISLIERVALFSVIYIFSSFIYKNYENPLRYKTAKFSIKSNKYLLFYFIAGVFFIFFVKQKVNYEEGWLWRLSDKSLDIVQQISLPKDFHRNNWGGAGYSPGWIGGVPVNDEVPDMILLGDSHAGHYLTGLESVMVDIRKKRIYIQDWYSSLKLPGIVTNLTEESKKSSKKSFEMNFERVMRYPNSPVVLSHSWVSQMNRSSLFNYTTNTYEEIERSLVGWKVLAAKIVEFHEMSGEGRKFVVIGETPSTGSNELNYIEKILRPKYLESIISTKSGFPNNVIEFNSFFESYFSPIENITFINPSKAFCENEVCLKQVGSEIYYSDAGHLSKSGSLKAIKNIEEELLDAISIND